MNELGYEPLKEIVIHIGEKGEFVDTEPVRVYVDGVKIKNLRGFLPIRTLYRTGSVCCLQFP